MVNSHLVANYNTILDTSYSLMMLMKVIKTSFRISCQQHYISKSSTFYIRQIKLWPVLHHFGPHYIDKPGWIPRLIYGGKCVSQKDFSLQNSTLLTPQLQPMLYTCFIVHIQCSEASIRLCICIQCHNLNILQNSVCIQWMVTIYLKCTYQLSWNLNLIIRI